MNSPVLGSFPDSIGESRVLPIRRECQSIVRAIRISCGPAEQARQLPATEQSVARAPCPRAESFTLTQRKVPQPVGVDLVSGIEVRRTAELVGRPRVDDLIPKAEAVTRR